MGSVVLCSVLSVCTPYLTPSSWQIYRVGGSDPASQFSEYDARRNADITNIIESCGGISSERLPLAVVRRISLYLTLVQLAHVCYETLHCFTLVVQILTEARTTSHIFFHPEIYSECILANQSTHGYAAPSYGLSLRTLLFYRKVLRRCAPAFLSGY